MTHNALRSLKREFSACTDEDARVLTARGKAGRRDIERDRRFDVDEEMVLAVLEAAPDERTSASRAHSQRGR